MKLSIITGIIIAASFVGFALIYSRSNTTNRSRPANNEGGFSTATSDTSSSYDFGSSSNENCADGNSSCDGGGDGGGGGD